MFAWKYVNINPKVVQFFLGKGDIKKFRIR